ncbi:MAG: helicase-related protein, partial [Stenotrophomonas maltophilia]
RFGVLQRSALRQKGVENPHSLVMSATPIPRTLSLTLYGDLDISTLDELPPGRQNIPTRWLGPERRPAAYGFLRKQVEAGRQGFIIYPLIDESEAIEAKAATEEYKRLSQEVFPDLKLGLLHGRMPAKEKDRVMRQFRDGELDILVSTAVVEVGIDVPNATVMMIEGADRFGLSQLHQFRGRVGRGEHKSYCILLSDSASEVAKERLATLEQIHDGFKLAEADLELRGPGDFFGTRQSGLPNLRMAHLSDRDLLDSAREEAAGILEKDPDLTAPEHSLLAAQVARFLDRVSAEFS